jgi:hypothetical protein
MYDYCLLFLLPFGGWNGCEGKWWIFFFRQMLLSKLKIGIFMKVNGIFCKFHHEVICMLP